MKHTALTVIVCLLAGCVGTPEAPPRSELPTDAVVETRAILFRAARLDATLLIEISRPATAESDDLPVIFTLDGATTFGLVAATARHLAARGEIPPAIVVGVHSEALDARPDAIIRFITTDLVRYLESEHLIDSSRSALIGYGASAEGVLQALFDLPTQFHGYLVVSPDSDGARHLAAEVEYASDHDDLPARVFFGVEGSATHETPEAGIAMVTAMTSQIRRRGYPNLHNETVIFEGESHASVLPAAISRGLRFIYRGDTAGSP